MRVPFFSGVFDHLRIVAKATTHFAVIVDDKGVVANYRIVFFEGAMYPSTQLVHQDAGDDGEGNGEKPIAVLRFFPGVTTVFRD